MCVKNSGKTITNNNQDYTTWSPPVFDISSPTSTTFEKNDQKHTSSLSSSVSLSHQDEHGVEGDSMPCKTEHDLVVMDVDMIHTSTTDDDDLEEEEEESINSSNSNNRKNNNHKKTGSPTLRRRERVSSASSMMEQRTVVEHKYHDHYHDSLSVVVCGGGISSNISSSSSGSSDHGLLVTKRPPGSARGGVTMAFPERLHEMLTTVEDEGLSGVISWQPHGRCFLIHKKNIFVEQVMPRFFHQSKLTSFQRQLNLYGFVRLTAGRDRGGYYHECFLRGRADLCRCMVRTRVKGNGMKAASSPDTEPNFYAMEPCVEDPHHEPREAMGIMIESDVVMSNKSNNTTSSTSTSRPSRSRNSSSSSRRSRKSRSSSTMFPSLEQAVAVELDEMYGNGEAAVMFKARPEEEDEDTTMDGMESCSIMPHASFSSDFPMMDLVSSMPSFPSSSLLAAMVSPPESPSLNAKKPLYMSKAAMHDIVESALNESDDDFDMMSPPSMPLHLPHSGDAVFFEGLKFRYLDHLDLVHNHVTDDDDNNTPGEDEPGATASV